MLSCVFTIPEQSIQSVRQEFTDLESDYNERRGNYDKIAVGLELEKQALEKDCDECQVRSLLQQPLSLSFSLSLSFTRDWLRGDIQEECLREESRFHYLNNLVAIARIRLERAEQEKKWQNKDGKMTRDFGSSKELYAVGWVALGWVAA